MSLSDFTVNGPDLVDKIRDTGLQDLISVGEDVKGTLDFLVRFLGGIDHSCALS
jgi:hypothetical protein